MQTSDRRVPALPAPRTPGGAVAVIDVEVHPAPSYAPGETPAQRAAADAVLDALSHLRAVDGGPEAMRARWAAAQVRRRRQPAPAANRYTGRIDLDELLDPDQPIAAQAMSLRRTAHRFDDRHRQGSPSARDDALFWHAAADAAETRAAQSLPAGADVCAAVTAIMAAYGGRGGQPVPIADLARATGLSLGELRAAFHEMVATVPGFQLHPRPIGTGVDPDTVPGVEWGGEHMTDLVAARPASTGRRALTSRPPAAAVRPHSPAARPPVSAGAPALDARGAKVASTPEPTTPGAEPTTTSLPATVIGARVVLVLCAAGMLGGLAALTGLDLAGTALAAAEFTAGAGTVGTLLCAGASARHGG